MDQCLPETAWAPSLQIRTSFLSSLCKDLGVSLPFSPNSSSLCEKDAGGGASGLPLALSSPVIYGCSRIARPPLSPAPQREGDGWGVRDTASSPSWRCLLHICPSRHSIQPSLCSLSLPRAPGDLSTLEEGSSEGFVQRPWTEEDKWNLQ